MDELNIRARVREMVETGQLPCEESGKVWAGRGNGTHCAACGEPIESTQIEFEVPLGPTARPAPASRVLSDLARGV